MINLARAMFGERLHRVTRSWPEQNRFGLANLSSFGEHFQRRRGYLVIADFRVYPDGLGHLDHLYLVEKVGDLFAAFAFIGYGFAGLTLRWPANGQNSFPRPLLADLIGRKAEIRRGVNFDFFFLRRHDAFELRIARLVDAAAAGDQRRQ